jgi:LysM repeat protein
MGVDDERYLPASPERSAIARILAVGALAAACVLLLVVVSSSLSSSEDGGNSANPAAERPERDKDGAETPKKYVVEPGDSLSGIAEKYGISVKRIERLNPDLDPNTLATGQTLKLR